MEFTSGHKAAAQDGRLVSENAAVPHVWQLWRCANTALLTGVARQLLIRCMCVMRRPESPRRELHRVMRTVCCGTHLKLKPDLARVDSKIPKWRRFLKCQLVALGEQVRSLAQSDSIPVPVCTTMRRKGEKKQVGGGSYRELHMLTGAGHTVCRTHATSF